MSLQTRILLIVLVVVSLYAAVDYASQYFFVLPSFTSLEHNEAQNIMRHCVAVLKREISNLDKTAKDWAGRHDTYQFVKDRNDDYIIANLTVESFTNNSLNLIYICDIRGDVVWGQIRNLETNEKMQLDEFGAESWPGTHPLLGHKTVKSSTEGVFMTKRGAMLVASRPIITYKNESPIGTIIMGRFLNDSVLKTIIEQAPVDLKVWTIANDSIPAKERDVLNHIKAESQFHISELGDSFLRVHTVICDIRGTPALLMRADVSRGIRARAITAFFRSTLLSNLTSGLFVLLVLSLLLRGTVVGPIRKLTAHAVAIGNSDNVAVRLTMRRSDEIGTLAQEFDRMVEQLAESRRKLSEQSYYLGKAEVASEVLHNARNVFTPLVSRIDNLRQKLREFPIEKIEVAQAELTERNPSEQRRENLTRLIDLSNKSLISLVRETKDILDNVAKQVAQIEEIVAEQSKFSRAEPLAEEIELYKLVQDSVGLLLNDSSDAISFEIDPSIEEIKPVRAHRITLLQVFNNILINAVESIHRAGTVPGKIFIRAENDEMDGVDIVHVQISDNGKGIERDNLSRIFERSFSTKDNVLSSFGLHWCANTIATMRGQIYAESQGNGRGACFHILLPSSHQTISASDAKTKVRS